MTAPVACRLDPQARLTLITSGLDMDQCGRSRTRKSLFCLPGQTATMMLCLEPDPDSPAIDTAPSVLTQRFSQASPDNARRPPFPLQIRDSPEGVAGFSANGIDFVAGASGYEPRRMYAANRGCGPGHVFQGPGVYCPVHCGRILIGHLVPVRRCESSSLLLTGFLLSRHSVYWYAASWVFLRSQSGCGELEGN